MNRLTKPDSKYTDFKNHKLQQYEGTGLMPGEVADLHADNARLRHLLTVCEQQRTETMDGLREVAAARDAAEARLGEAVGVLEDFAGASYYLIPQTQAQLDYSAKTRTKAKQFLQSPAAKAGERVKAMEMVADAAKKAHDFLEIRALGCFVTEELGNALDALEGVKGE